jgi:uncharacterized membrane protein YeiB
MLPTNPELVQPLNRVLWHSRLVADGCFIPLLANLFGLPLSMPPRAEETLRKASRAKTLSRFRKKIGHQKLTTLAREPFDLSTLLSRLCDIASSRVLWHSRLVADGCFIPLLANLFGLPLSMPPRGQGSGKRSAVKS